MYDRNIGEQNLTFRFNREVLKNNLLFEDLQTGSIWSQLDQKAVKGPLEGTELRALPAVQTSWKHWKELHPETWVLSPRLLGLSEKSYEYLPTWDGTETFVRGMRPRELVLALDLGGAQKAYPFRELEKAGGEIEDAVGGKTIHVLYDEASRSALVKDEDGQPLAAVTVYWNNWLEFHPFTDVYWARRRSFRGILEAVDTETGVLQVTDEKSSETRTFSVTADTWLRGNRRVLGKQDIVLSDLIPGLVIEVRFIQGAKEAQQVRVRGKVSVFED